jgi:hypothetical protein
LFGTSGVFFSSLMRRTLGATVLTYAFALLATLGLPLVLVALLPLTNFLFYNSPPGPLLETVMIYGLGVLIATNPIATAVTTEILLVTEQTALYWTLPISNGVSLPLISPWLPFILFCLFLGTLLVLLSILAVRRAEQ